MIVVQPQSWEQGTWSLNMSRVGWSGHSGEMVRAGSLPRNGYTLLTRCGIEYKATVQTQEQEAGGREPATHHCSSAFEENMLQARLPCCNAVACCRLASLSMNLVTSMPLIRPNGTTALLRGTAEPFPRQALLSLRSSCRPFWSRQDSTLWHTSLPDSERKNSDHATLFCSSRTA